MKDTVGKTFKVMEVDLVEQIVNQNNIKQTIHSELKTVGNLFLVESIL